MAKGDGRAMNYRNRESEIEIPPSDKPIKITITTVVKRGCQFLSLPPGAKIRHKPLTTTDEKP